ncbi:hypothetical protein LINPERPRIM_LOCUS628 [Linum perenne]
MMSREQKIVTYRRRSELSEKVVVVVKASKEIETNLLDFILFFLIGTEYSSFSSFGLCSEFLIRKKLFQLTI